MVVAAVAPPPGQHGLVTEHGQMKGGLHRSPYRMTAAGKLAQSSESPENRFA